MKSFICFLCLFCLISSAKAQEGKLIHQKATAFSLDDKNDTVEFIVVDTSITEKKPVFLWCQGSLPQPLFGELGNRDYHFQGGGIANFDYDQIVKNYHLVAISMPHTPLSVSAANLTEQFLYVPDKTRPREFDARYIEDDYLDNYVSRARRVLTFLKEQAWVAPDNWVVAGHSQGTKVATKIARERSEVKNLALFNPNPFGRIDQLIRQARADAESQKITWKTADSLMTEYYEFFSKSHHQDSVRQDARLLAWQTFSEPSLDDWLSLTIPIYIAYGTEDMSSALCDMVPLFFIAEKKSTLTIERYPGLEHNFFEVDQMGELDPAKGHWDQVMDDFLQYLQLDKKPG